MDVDNINIMTKIIFLSLWVFRNLYLPLRHVECAPQIFDLLVEALCSLVNWKPRKFSIADKDCIMVLRVYRVGCYCYICSQRFS